MIRLTHILNEIKTGNDFIDFLLQKIQPVIDDIVALQKQKALKDGERFGKYEEEITELTLKYDLLKALGNFTVSSDKMIKGSVSNSNKGALTIDALIERDGEQFPLHTDVIYAGGYNIQKLHFRYLTKTKLPRRNSNPEADKVKAELARLSKGEKLRTDINRYSKEIEDKQKLVDASSKLNDKQIFDKIYADGQSWRWPEWKEIVKRGAAVNYNNDENYYNTRKAADIEYNMVFWKEKHIKWPMERIKYYNKEIEKLQKKLNALV
jgi:hypothetical protein